MSCICAIKETHIDFVAGTLGGCAGTLVEHPFDTVKVLLQADREGLYKNSSLRCCRSVLRNNGIRGLYAGLSARICISGFEHALILALYRWALITFGRETADRPGVLDVVMAGSVTGALGGMLLTPFELLKCRMQSEADASTQQTMRDAARGVMRTDGVKGLFRGCSATLLREVPGTVAWLGGYEAMKAIFSSYNGGSSELSIPQTIVAGGISGVFYWSIFFPADVVKTRMQVEKASTLHKMTFFSGLRQLYSEAGVRGLYRGYSLAIIRSFPSNAVLFTVFEGVRSCALFSANRPCPHHNGPSDT